MKKTISPETAKVVENYALIISNAIDNHVPCYIAGVPLGLTPKDYMTGVLGLSDEIPAHTHIKESLGKTDFKNYMIVLQDVDTSNTKLTLFEPIFAFPEGNDNNVRTLRIVFEDPAKNGENVPTFFDVAN